MNTLPPLPGNFANANTDREENKLADQISESVTTVPQPVESLPNDTIQPVQYSQPQTPSNNLSKEQVTQTSLGTSQALMQPQQTSSATALGSPIAQINQNTGVRTEKKTDTIFYVVLFLFFVALITTIALLFIFINR